ncbi:MAG: transcriptional repressor LexA [Phycisphaerae bacterium]
MPKREPSVGSESENLTPRQLDILVLIRNTRRDRGYSPTLQEMADYLGINKVTVHEHVQTLVKKGLLIHHSNKARSLRLTDAVRLPDERPTVLPVVGTIAAGSPIEAIEQQDDVDLETLFTSRHPVRVLNVRGESMIDEQIRDGDLVVYEARSNATNGDTVVALVDGEEATLKTYFKEKNRIRLQPANPNYEPIYSQNVEIQGVVIGILRRY